jgi:Domain of unknown function (DUF4386)
MPDPLAASPRAKARRAGTLYLISAGPAGFSVFVFLKLVVPGNPAATAANILGSESLFRLGFVADLVGILFFVGAVVALYDLFSPAGKGAARLFLLFNLIGAGIESLDSIQDLTALILLKGGTSLAALSTQQAHALALVFLRLHMLSYVLAMVFFGSASVVLGYLIRRSAFLPRVLGVLLVIDGAGYLVFSLSNFLSPPFATHLYPFLPYVTAIVGEASLMLWLIVKGVDDDSWAEQARARERVEGRSFAGA